MRLRPEYKDSQTCLRCGAPAMILGEPWNHTEHGELVEDFFRVPIEIRCNEHTPGAELRHRDVTEGRQKKSVPYYVRVFTHVCMRDAGCDALGNVSDAEEHRYECGALQAAHVGRGDLRPFRRCWDTDESFDLSTHMSISYSTRKHEEASE